MQRFNGKNYSMFARAMQCLIYAFYMWESNQDLLLNEAHAFTAKDIKLALDISQRQSQNVVKYALDLKLIVCLNGPVQKGVEAFYGLSHEGHELATNNMPYVQQEAHR